MKEFRFPTIIGLLIILVGLLGVMYVANNYTGGIIKADLSYKPKNILISNFKPDQITISWQTEKSAEGFIAYGDTKEMELFALDKRDYLLKKRGSYKNHYVSLYGLTPGKTYYFKIGSNNKLFGGVFSLSQNCQDYINDLNNKPFVFTTPNLPNKMVRDKPASGLIVENEEEKKPISGIIVCLSIPNSLPLSDLTSSSGNFLIPFYTILKRDLTLLEEINDEISEEFYAFSEKGEITYAKIRAGNDHPMPLLKLGENYDFTKKIDLLEQIFPMQIISLSPTKQPNVINQPSGYLNPTNNPLPSLTPPITNQDLVELSFPTGEVADTIPTFRGKGKPGLVFDITVESPQIFKDTIKIDSNGFWTWTIPGNLSPGLHSVAISYRDENNNLKTLEKTFVVVSPNPLLPANASTPSATLIPLPTNTPFPTPTLTPTLIPTNTPTLIPTVAQELPPSGLTYPYFFILTSALLSIILGIGLSISYKRK